MKDTSSIILIIPYFGSWPIWIDLFVDSVRRNPTVNFLIITDCDPSIFNGIENVVVTATTFDDYVSRYKKKLKIDIQIPNPYKICDLRPFFGVIHECEIEKYDFFGWTDIDILFGNIRSFYTSDILKRHDVLSTHEVRLAGHFALIRNNSFYRTIGFKIYDWKVALLNPKFIGIDEHGMTNALTMTVWDKLGEKFNQKWLSKLFSPIRKRKCKRYYFKEQYTTPFTAIPWIDDTYYGNQPSEWFYHRGQLVNSRDQKRNFMYLHFMNFKSSQWRGDGSVAPWEKSFRFEVTDVNKVVIINELGFFNRI